MFGGAGAEGVRLHAAGDGRFLVGDGLGVDVGVDQHDGVGGRAHAVDVGFGRADADEAAGEDGEATALAEDKGAEAERCGLARERVDGEEREFGLGDVGVGVLAHGPGESIGAYQAGSGGAGDVGGGPVADAGVMRGADAHAFAVFQDVVEVIGIAAGVGGDRRD